MPVPLNAAVEVTRAWLTKKLGYVIDTSVPVRPSKEAVRATTPMDIDLICTHRWKEEVHFCLDEWEYRLPRNLLVECKR